MSNKNKRRPARPHWEQITKRTASGAETRVPESDYNGPFGGYKSFKTGSTKRPPGK